MIVHKFTCRNESEPHTFYIPLELPQPVEVIGKLLLSISSCPICTSAVFIDINQEWQIRAMGGNKHESL